MNDIAIFADIIINISTAVNAIWMALEKISGPSVPMAGDRRGTAAVVKSSFFF